MWGKMRQLGLTVALKTSLWVRLLKDHGFGRGQKLIVAPKDRIIRMGRVPISVGILIVI